MMQSSVIRGWVMLVLLVAIGGCGDNAPPDSVAEQVAIRLMDSLKAKDLNQAIKLYDTAFFERVSSEEWAAQLETWQTELGDMDRYLVRRKQVDTRYSGKFYVYEYEAIHARGRATHMVTLVWPAGGSVLELVGHKVTVTPTRLSASP
jgi:hypothetical protein